MYDSGFARATATPDGPAPPIRTLASEALVFLLRDSDPWYRRASSSITIWPTLWRVWAYSGPGFPRPTTTTVISSSRRFTPWTDKCERPAARKRASRANTMKLLGRRCRRRRRGGAFFVFGRGSARLGHEEDREVRV